MNPRSYPGDHPQRSSAYILAELLHEGSSCVLYRGYRIADREPIIAKLLKSEYPSPRDLARLRHEYSIAREIDAPGVVKTYGLEEIEGRLALVLEDFGGLSLSDILRTERLDRTTALQIGALLADAVGAIHDHHIIHKDIKPHNILVNRATGQVKLIDFGIASRLSLETHRATRPDALEGTLSYMSPEQTGRMNRSVDSRTDLYSLGVTLFEMLTGTLPFAAKDPMEMVHSHIARAPPAPHEREPAIPRVVSDIVLKLLAKSAEDRYQSAHGLKADLETSLAQWRASGEIEPFPLGRRDAPLELRLAQRLYGRQEEKAALVEAFERASAGGCELLLVKGPAGVGKSALVGEIQPAIGLRGALFSAGKFDQRSRAVPALAFSSTLRDLIRQLLSEPPEALSTWTQSLRAAIGARGRVLTDLIPELTLIIGPQAPAPEVGPSEAQNLFGMAFRDFLHVFTTREHPLVLFLDDLQWADPASLNLLTLFLSDAA
jgi:tRNA A-37 threonylcarbamoyl transferase component Bud32